MNYKIEKLLQLYREGKNIAQYLRETTSSSKNSTEMIEVIYDLQAGTYVRNAENESVFIENYTKGIYDILKEFSPGNILEVGCGEATTISNVAKRFSQSTEVLGFDISFSRLLYANQYFKSIDAGQKGCFFMGDMFNIPLADNSIDVVYTSHSIEPNGGKETEALKELYRVTKNYLVLLEPSYELGSVEAQTRMKEHGYITCLVKSAQELGLKVIEHRLFEHCFNPLNPTGLIIIEKNKERSKTSSNQSGDFPFICPVTKKGLKLSGDFCYTEEPGYIYPLIKDIPCLLEKNRILATHVQKF